MRLEAEGVRAKEQDRRNQEIEQEIRDGEDWLSKMMKESETHSAEQAAEQAQDVDNKERQQ